MGLSTCLKVTFIVLMVVLCILVSIRTIQINNITQSLINFSSKGLYNMSTMGEPIKTISRGPKGNTTKKIGLWSAYWRDNTWDLIPKGKMNVTIKCPSVCLISRDRTSSLIYDALLFNSPDNQHPPEARRQNQLFIMQSHEPPTMFDKEYIRGGNFYNLTATYRSDSDIFLPFWYAEKKTRNSSTNYAIELPQMNVKRQESDAMILWIVGHCKTSAQREQYVNHLKQYIKVDVYGRCGKRCPKKDCHNHLGKTGRYKFYLGFENSACSEYITKKSARGMGAGLVPIVYGALSSKQYFEKFPPNSFIDTRNFSSPKHLADYLIHLDNHPNEYLAFHTWRRNYEIKKPNRWCSLCTFLHNSSTVHHRTVDWGKYWTKKDCSFNLLKDVKVVLSYACRYVCLCTYICMYLFIYVILYVCG